MDEQSKLLEVAVEWRGAEALRPFLVPIDSLQEYAGNPRRGDVDAIAASLKRFGQVKPVILKGDRKTIVAGHHIMKGARKLGWDKIAVLPVSFETERDALAYLMADNRLSDLGSYDATQQLSILEDMETSANFEGTGFTPDDLEDLRAAMEAVPTTAPVDWQGEHAEGADTAAQRAERLAVAVPMKEVVMLLTMEQYETFGGHLRTLRSKYGTSGVIETIMTAVKREAEAS